MAEEENQEGEEKPKSKMLLFIIIGLVALMAGGGIAAFFMMSGGSDTAAGDASKEPVNRPAIYYDLKPPFVVNYSWKGRQRYVQISAAIMTRDEKAIEALQKHMPLVQANLVEIFGSQDFEGLRTPEGKEALRQTALVELQKIVNDEIGSPGVEKLLFTNFVMQ